MTEDERRTKNSFFGLETATAQDFQTVKSHDSIVQKTLPVLSSVL